MDTKLFLEPQQPSLPYMASSAPAPATVDELGLRGCLYLWALLTGQEYRLPVAQTKRMTLVAMGYLQERGVIEVPWPVARWELKPEAQITPIEGLQWHLSWTVYDSLRPDPKKESPYMPS